MIRNTIIQEYLFAHLTGIEHRYEPEEVVMRLNGVQNDSNEQDIAAVKAARAAAEETVEAAAERIIGMNHGVLVCSSIYTQINAGLVICRLVKERNPKIKTMIGGSVSGETGIRILKDYRYIDFVSLGEGDDTVAQACEILLGRTEEPLPYGIVSYEDIDHLSEIPHPLTADMNTVPSPEYRDYLEEVHREEAGFYGENFYETGAALGYSGNHTLYLEGSRG